MTLFEITDELKDRAEGAPGYWQFKAGNDDLILDALAGLRKVHGDDYDRAEAFDWFKGMEDLAWEWHKPGDLVRLFCLPDGTGGDRVLGHYSLCDEIDGEEEVTRKGMAESEGVPVASIYTRVVPRDEAGIGRY